MVCRSVVSLACMVEVLLVSRTFLHQRADYVEIKRALQGVQLLLSIEPLIDTVGTGFPAVRETKTMVTIYRWLPQDQHSTLVCHTRTIAVLESASTWHTRNSTRDLRWLGITLYGSTAPRLWQARVEDATSSRFGYTAYGLHVCFQCPITPLELLKQHD